MQLMSSEDMQTSFTRFFEGIPVFNSQELMLWRRNGPPMCVHNDVTFLKAPGNKKQGSLYDTNPNFMHLRGNPPKYHTFAACLSSQKNR